MKRANRRAEEALLLTAAREPLRSIILTGIYAGLRIESEAPTLPPADVDFRTRFSTDHFTTPAESRILALSNRADSKGAPVAQVDRAAVS